MSQARRSIDGEVALVVGGGEGGGRAMALQLGALGVRVVVAGSDERAVAMVVGEITCGGGVARHFAGDMSNPAHVEASIQKAVETFTKLSLVIVSASEESEITRIFEAAIPHLVPPARLLAVSTGEPFLGTVSTLAARLSPQGVTCNAIAWDAPLDAEPRALVALAVHLCSDAADEITGQAFSITG